MSQIGKIESIWRYPVKSMKGETLDGFFGAFKISNWRSQSQPTF